MLVVGFSGKKDSGKDTGANHLAAEWLSPKLVKGAAPRTMGFAWPLKKFCSQWLGVPLHLSMGTDADKNTVMTHLLWEKQPNAPEGKMGPMTVREVLQHWGTDVLRRVDPDIHVKAWVREANMVKETGCPLLFVPDVRFPNEIAGLLAAFSKGRVVRLTRAPNPGDTHASETSLDTYDWKSDERLYLLDNTQTIAHYKRDLSRWFQHTFKDEIGVRAI